MKQQITAIALGLLSAAPAAADTVLGLTGDRTLVMIDTATAQVTGTMDIAVEGRVLGLDYRPNTREVIAVTEDFSVITIDTATGAVAPLVQMQMPLPIAAGASVIVDINPAADALRFMSGTVNHRVNLASGAVTVDGSLHFDAASAQASMVPMVAGTAYSNAFGRPEATAMYNIDAAMNALLRQTAPNDGTNVVIGALGASVARPLAFDIATDAGGLNTAWLAQGGMLHTISLETGAVTGSWEIGGLEGALRDMTVLPAM
jgi:hypothetical protein